MRQFCFNRFFLQLLSNPADIGKKKKKGTHGAEGKVLFFFFNEITDGWIVFFGLLFLHYPIRQSAPLASTDVIIYIVRFYLGLVTCALTYTNVLFTK